MEEKKEVREEKVSLKDFLGEYGSSLRKKVVDAFCPVYDPREKNTWDNEAEAKLNKLKRKPFPAQTDAIIALAKGFFLGKKEGLALVGEMGTGKTFCSIAVSHLIPKPNYRVLVMCPPHLVQKWIREVEVTLPECRTVNLNGKGLKELDALRHAGKPACPEFYIMGKERAKAHYRVKKAWQEQKHIGRMLCPACGRELSPDDLTGKRPICPNPDCREPLYEADRNGFRRFAKAEYIKKYLKGKFDLFIADEVHELKGGTTAQGQAFADLACVAKRTLALTGTLMGGYSTNLFYIFWRLMPGKMQRKGQKFNSPRTFAQEYGIVERSWTEKDDYTDCSIGRSRGARVTTKEKPGASPLILTDFLLEHTVFVRLADISSALPPFDEKVVEINMTEEQGNAYRTFSDVLRDTVRKALARGNKCLLGALVNSLLAYPDGARRGEVVFYPHTKDVVADAPLIEEHILPKERELLDIIHSELSEGRKCMVCLEHTGTRDLIPDLQERMLEQGINPLILRSNTVSTEQREAWVQAKMASGEYNVMIANPNLIKTGLDLLEFPTIIFFQTGYSLFTLRQASRRSWRIGQKEPVRVYYLSYTDTMQAMALSLIATKMETALAIEGDLSNRGLTALSEGANSMLVELARTLIGEDKSRPVSEAWARYKEKEFATDSFIDDESPETVTTTTTFTKGDRSASVTYKRIVRGRIYPKRGYGVGYIDNGNKFLFKKGRILWNGKECGDYSAHTGEIGGKPIEIVRAPGRNYYLLVELRTR